MIFYRSFSVYLFWNRNNERENVFLKNFFSHFTHTLYSIQQNFPRNNSIRNNGTTSNGMRLWTRNKQRETETQNLSHTLPVFVFAVPANIYQLLLYDYVFRMLDYCDVVEETSFYELDSSYFVIKVKVLLFWKFL